MNNNGSISLGTTSRLSSSINRLEASSRKNIKLQRELLEVMNKKFKQSNDRLRNELEATKAELIQVKRHAAALERQVRASQTNHQGPTFSKIEIRTMLSKLHPDKNDGKTIYNKITAKLIGLTQ